MASLGAQLSRGLEAGPVPMSKPDLMNYAGGRGELVRQLSGLDGPPRPGNYSSTARGRAQYSDDRRRWLSTQRRVQRWTTEAGERRGKTPARLTPAQKGAIRKAANERHRKLLRRRGLRARLTATVQVSRDRRVRTMPVPPRPGVLISGDEVGDILDLVAEEGREAGADDFLVAFFNAYGIGAEVEIDESETISLKVWLNGDREPQ